MLRCVQNDRSGVGEGRIVHGAGAGVYEVGLVEGVDGQAAEEFGVKVSGFLGHDVAGEGDVAELVEGDGLDEEGDVGLAGDDLLETASAASRR